MAIIESVIRDENVLISDRPNEIVKWNDWMEEVVEERLDLFQHLEMLERRGELRSKGIVQTS